MKSTAPLSLLQLVLLLLLSTTKSVSAFDYVLAPATTYRVRLVDLTTNVSDIPTVFLLANATVHVDGLHWQTATTTATSSRDKAQLVYTTYLNGDPVGVGSHNLSTTDTGTPVVPPLTITTGSIQFPEPGRHNVTVTMQVVYEDAPAVDTPLVSTERDYQVYWPIITLAPIVVLCFLAWLTGNVEISISTTNMVAVCISQGDFLRGMEHMVYGSFLGALTDRYNGVIMLLVFFLSGIISLVEVSGGSKGWVRFVARYIHSTRIVQCLAFILGLVYFWDDTLSMLIVGHLMRPLLDVAHTSRPLGALILDATAGPISGIILLSTWLVWEIPLLQQELSRIDTIEDDNIPALDMTPLQVLQESLRFAFYPIFTLILLPLLLWSQRHMGQILMYERVTQVYRLKTGGPKDIRGPCQPNPQPPSGTPYRFWNALFPLTIVSLLFIVFWFQTGQRGAEALAYEVDYEEHWVVSAYAYALTPLAWCQAISMASAFFVVSLLLQFQQGNSILFVPCNITTLWRQHKQKQHHETQQDDYDDNNTHNAVMDPASPKHQTQEDHDDEPQEQDYPNAIVSADDDDDDDAPSNDGLMRRDDNNNNDPENDNFLLPHPEEEFAKPLLPMMDLIASFFFGFARIMPYMIQFILAWSLRQTLTDMGLDRWFASILGDQLEALQTPYIPIAAFLTAFFMSLATGGASRGKAASILLPMVIAPVYEKTHVTDPDMIFQVIGAILSGCIAGDHAAPLSNSTLLSCLSSDCHVMVHVISQIPYIGVVLFLSLILGTGPVGYGIYPLGAGYFLGVVCMLFFVFFICYPVLDLSGQWDLVTRLYIRCWVKRKSKQNDITNNNADEDDNQEEDPEDLMRPPRNPLEDEEEEGNFWDILQRDTARAANAIAQGIPYQTEDCRHLMNPLDSAITKDEHDDAAVAGPTSSSSEEEASIGMNNIAIHHVQSPVSTDEPDIEHEYEPHPHVVEDHGEGEGRPVKIITPVL